MLANKKYSFKGNRMKNKPIVKISHQSLEGIKGQIGGRQHIMLVLSDF